MRGFWNKKKSKRVMKKFSYLLTIVMLTCILVSCSISKLILGGTDETIKPGDKIGEMIVEQSAEIPYQNI